MLYELWLETAKDRRSDWALWEYSSGRRWSFSELAEAVEKEAASGEPVLFPQGMEAAFLMTVLKGWRNGATILPLEQGQTPPALVDSPKGMDHLKTTSGSSGMPKFVAFRGEQLAADARQIVDTMGLRADWPNVAVLSLAHSYGFSNQVLPLLLHGIPLVLVDTPLPEVMLNIQSALPHITLPSVPALWKIWNDSNALTSSIRLAISAGAPLPLSLEEAIWSQKGIKIHNFYGASECGGIAYDRSERPRTDPSFVGEAMEGVQLSVDSDRRLCVRSQAVASSYWPKPSPDLQNSLFRTGDLAELNGGQVFLRGRVSDTINVSGRKICPEEIERALCRHPQVEGAVVFGVPTDQSRNEQVVACVSGEGLSVPLLRNFLMADLKLPAWQVPKDWWLLREIAVNARGKISRAEWRLRFLEQRRALNGS